MSSGSDPSGAPSSFSRENAGRQDETERLQSKLRSSARLEVPRRASVDDDSLDEATRFDIKISMQQESETDTFGADTDIRYVAPGFLSTDEVDASSTTVDLKESQKQLSSAVEPSKPRPPADGTDPAIVAPAPATVSTTESIEIGKCFARGGMAELYHARRIGGPDHKKRFVMKKLLKELQREPVYVERFKNEAKVTSGLRHPHIIETYEIGQHQDQWYIAMEYLPGRDLGNVLNRLHHFDVQCPVEIVLEIAIAVSKALGHVHALRIVDETGARIVHRDVNPANVMVTWDGQIKLLDFGLAKDPDQDLTGGGEMVGKLMYQPPEAIKGDRPSPQWDVYAVGLLMFELLSGRAPFGGLMSSSQLMARIVTEDLDDIQSLNATVPDAIARIVRRATAKTPSQRYTTMAEVIGALENALVREVGGRGDVKTFMRVLYQEEDAKVPARVQLGQAAPRNTSAPRRRPMPRRKSPSPVRRTPEVPTSKAEKRKNALMIFGGVALLGVVSGAMYWTISRRTGLENLDEIDASAYIETGVHVRCRSGRVLLDGVQLGRCPSVATPTSVGRYTVRVEDGDETVERTIMVGSGQLVELDLRSE